MRRFVSFLAVLTLAAGLAGCGAASTPAPTAATPVVSEAWIRWPTAPGGPAAAYLKITNPGGIADALIGASSPAAMSCELHETSMDSSGMAGMHPVDRLEIPARGTVTLEQGGYHLMLMGMKDLIAGSEVELRLEFEKAGIVTVKVPVPQG